MKYQCQKREDRKVASEILRSRRQLLQQHDRLRRSSRRAGHGPRGFELCDLVSNNRWRTGFYFVEVSMPTINLNLLGVQIDYRPVCPMG